jgi:hypothetical protein
MAVDRGQGLMLILAVPAVCLLLVVLTHVETWLLHDQGPPAGGQPATSAGQGGQAPPMLAPPSAVDTAAAGQAAAGEEDAPGAAPPGGISEAA